MAQGSQTFVHPPHIVYTDDSQMVTKPPSLKRMEVTVEKIATHKYGILVINMLIYPGIKLVNKYLLSPSLYSRFGWGVGIQ